MSAPVIEKPAKRQTLKSARLARAHWLYSIEDVIALYLVSRNVRSRVSRIRISKNYGVAAGGALPFRQN
ncbi:hypothetical protein [Roseibium denhamense]|uniref:hypothetical protein n=1 Tax=Roseibium denhamense TaxID=76305 RepID=UPI0031D76E0B